CFDILLRTEIVFKRCGIHCFPPFNLIDMHIEWICLRDVPETVTECTAHYDDNRFIGTDEVHYSSFKCACPASRKDGNRIVRAEYGLQSRLDIFHQLVEII